MKKGLMAVGWIEDKILSPKQEAPLIYFIFLITLSYLCVAFKADDQRIVCDSDESLRETET